MAALDRRKFLAAGASVMAAPVAAPLPVLAQGGGDVDVVIVGAGAAGIAAARRVQAAGRRCVVLEASDRIGGRCVTDTASFGVAFDRGAHALRWPDANPLARLGRAARFEIAARPPGQRLQIGARVARENEVELFLSALVRARRAIEEAADEENDRAAGRALPRDLGEWRATVEFMLGPLVCGKNLDEVSNFDLTRLGERERDAYCRPGYGALLAKLAEGLPVRLGTPATRVSIWRGNTSVETPKGALRTRAVIVTCSTAMIAAGKIRFDPGLPTTHTEAAAKLALGAYERVALELPGNPLGLGRDEMVVERAADARTAALLANAGGTSLCYVDVAGRFARSLERAGEPGLKAFAVDWLAGLFGNDVRKAVRRAQATQWGKAPWIMGAMSAAAPGAQGAREALAEPVRDRIFFAGEATHQTHWGSVNGAWEAGERAADLVLRRRGGGRAPARRRRR